MNRNLWLGLALLLALATPAATAPPEKSLLTRATRVSGLEDQAATGSAATQVTNPWLLGHQLLHVHRKTLFLYDTAAHTDTALPGLMRQVTSSGCPIAFLTAASGAPWVMWGQSTASSIYAASVDGSKRCQWPGYGGMTMAYWCKDARHLIRFAFGGGPTTVRYTEAHVETTDAPERSSTVAPLPLGLRSLEILAVVSEHRVVARTPDPVKFGGETSLPKSIKKALKKMKKGESDNANVSSMFTEEVTERPTQEISVWNLDSPTSLHRYVIHLPGKGQEMAVSPEGDRVAWLLSPASGRSAPASSLWVSGVDGSGLREIGAVRWPPHPEMDGIPTQIHWLPGVRRISFVYRNALWTVPVN